jgi:hypothetical protein
MYRFAVGLNRKAAGTLGERTTLTTSAAVLAFASLDLETQLEYVKRAKLAHAAFLAERGLSS